MITIALTPQQAESVVQQHTSHMMGDVPAMHGNAPVAVAQAPHETTGYNFASLYGRELEANGRLHSKEVRAHTTGIAIEITIPPLRRPATFLAEELLTGDGAKRGNLSTHMGIGGGGHVYNGNANIGSGRIAGYRFPASSHPITCWLNVEQKDGHAFHGKINIILR